MSMTTKSLETLDKNSTQIAGVSDGGTITESLYWHTTCLYRHRDGKWYLREFGGAAMAVDNDPEWITREDAVKWVATKARDSITGYGYTREQAEIMVDGGDAGPGYRGRD